ncbi:MAG: DinB family protein, partial [Anaerolineales bacterium]|nr:DinB family protein [Anaerolineales bacterium]
MLNYQAVVNREMTLEALGEGLSVADLRTQTNLMIDEMLAVIADCTDEDVVFVPHDPEAHDAAAASEADEGISWTLGHVVVHTTASAEESAVLAAEMARGVSRPGRSRAEVPWETVTTMAQCRARLAESRR